MGCGILIRIRQLTASISDVISDFGNRVTEVAAVRMECCCPLTAAS